jgi:large subunit ribosomal protein L17
LVEGVRTPVSFGKEIGKIMSHRKFGRKTGPRRALLRNLVTSFFIAERIETTESKAKEVNRLAEKLVTLAKRGDLHARRLALAYMLDENAVTKLFEKIGPRYEGRDGGYTRIIKKGNRQGDGALIVILELV